MTVQEQRHREGGEAGRERDGAEVAARGGGGGAAAGEDLERGVERGHGQEDRAELGALLLEERRGADGGAGRVREGEERAAGAGGAAAVEVEGDGEHGGEGVERREPGERGGPIDGGGVCVRE